MPAPVLRRPLAPVLLLLAVAPLSGCSGEEVAADELVAVVETAVAGVTVARIDVEGELDPDGEGPDDGGDVEVHGDVQAAPRALQGRVEWDGEQAQVIVLDEAFLLADDGATWVRMDVDLLADRVGTGPATAALVDPLLLLEALAATVTSGSLEGTDDDGDHYRVETPSVDFLGEVAPDPTAPDATAPDTTATDDASLDHDLWVDAEGRITRAEISLGDLGELALTFSGHDAGRVIQAPPASRTATLQP